MSLIHWVADKVFSLALLAVCAGATLVVAAILTIMCSAVGLGNIPPASFLMFYQGLYVLLWGSVVAVVSFVVVLFCGHAVLMSRRRQINIIVATVTAIYLIVWIVALLA